MGLRSRDGPQALLVSEDCYHPAFTAGISGEHLGASYGRSPLPGGLAGAQGATDDDTGILTE
jgi:hypothetical protein